MSSNMLVTIQKYGQRIMIKFILRYGQKVMVLHILKYGQKIIQQTILRYGQKHIQLITLQIILKHIQKTIQLSIPRYGLIGLGYSAHNATTDSSYFHSPGLFHFSSRPHA